MIYSSPEFFILFFATLGLAILVPSRKGRLILYLASSLLFYAWSGFADTAIFLSVVVFSWSMTALARKYPLYKGRLVSLGILIMALHLFFWKYASWVSSIIQGIYPGFLGGHGISLPLPVGISFFTLQGIAYLVDFKADEAKYMRFPKYLLFKSFFPQLVAGPIVRARQLAPQLEKLKRPGLMDFRVGISLFGLGFFKKIVVADHLSILADAVFNNPSHLRSGMLLNGLLAYTVQIWADFSGYTDMGRGAARCLGIELPQNFLSPYLSKTPSEFWSRWHITLSQWIRDYIYIPLGGNRGSRLRVVIVLLVTMGISGLWHGANWNFLVWGFYHGALLVFERAIRGSRIAALTQSVCPALAIDSLLWLSTFSSVVFGWLLFRAQHLADVPVFVEGLLWNQGTLEWASSPVFIYFGYAFCVFAHVAFSGRVGGVHAFAIELWERVSSCRWADAMAGGLVAALFVLTMFLKNPEVSKSFIYFQF